MRYHLLFLIMLLGILLSSPVLGARELDFNLALYKEADISEPVVFKLTATNPNNVWVDLTRWEYKAKIFHNGEDITGKNNDVIYEKTPSPSINVPKILLPPGESTSIYIPFDYSNNLKTTELKVGEWEIYPTVSLTYGNKCYNSNTFKENTNCLENKDINLNPVKFSIIKPEVISEQDKTSFDKVRNIGKGIYDFLGWLTIPIGVLAAFATIIGVVFAVKRRR